MVEVAAASEEVVAEAFRLGYGTVAFEERMDVSELGKKGSHWKARFDGIVRDYDTPLSSDLRLVHRLTIVLSGPRLELPSKAALFDVVAVEPRDEAAFARACAHDDVDLVSLNAVAVLRRAPVLQARKRGAFFELCYGRGQERLRHLVALAARLADASYGRGIVLSSGAADPRRQHAPTDAANLAANLGFTSMPEDLLAHCAERRRDRRRLHSLHHKNLTWVDPRSLGIPSLFVAVAEKHDKDDVKDKDKDDPAPPPAAR
mmetsp:Transcript_16183/g.52670  ORF Transcript_16183/g.52670 Transcript_16183/m.52670 type:complete len:260 (-) Transcript_16183:29-808(-)